MTTIVAAYKRALYRITKGIDATFTVAELADVAGVSESHMTQVANPQRVEANLSIDRLEKVARYLASHGEYRLSRCFLPDACTIVTVEQHQADGCLMAENADVTKLMGRLLDEYESGADGMSLESIMAQLRVCMDRIQADVNLRKASRA